MVSASPGIELESLGVDVTPAPARTRAAHAMHPIADASSPVPEKPLPAPSSAYQLAQSEVELPERASVVARREARHAGQAGSGDAHAHGFGDCRLVKPVHDDLEHRVLSFCQSAVVLPTKCRAIRRVARDVLTLVPRRDLTPAAHDAPRKR